jgi:DNA mismatch endonuclease (patch repair protein)
MADRLTPEARSALMSRIRGKDTKPELAVRRMLHSMGYRFRLHRKDLPGRPDIVFPGRRKVIFVHGCFWHGHGCKIGRPPGSRLEYWGPKIEANRTRDRRKSAELRASGWSVATLWQCALRSPGLDARLRRFLGPPGAASAQAISGPD